MFYTIYRVTNNISGKLYIGSHKTCDLNDGYMGSGKYLKRAIEKYGIDNFTKDILFVFQSPEEMYAKEAELVNEDFLATENTYNLKLGGFGGFDYINANPEKYLTEKRLASLRSEESAQVRQKKWRERYDEDESFREVVLNNARKANEAFKLKYPQGTFGGHVHKEDTKQLLSQKAKERLQDPAANSQYGTRWITDGTENKKVKKVDSIPDGWTAGRTIKYSLRASK